MKGQNYSYFNLPNREIRPPEAVQEDNISSYIDKCDEETFYYDVMKFEDKFSILAPPLELEEVVFLYDKFFFNNNFEAEKYVYANKQEILTTEAYTRILTELEPVAANDIMSKQTSELVKLIKNGIFKNISYTLQRNNSLAWIVDWAKWCVDRCGSDLVVIYDNDSSAYNSLDIFNALENEGIRSFVMDVPYKYGPAWVPSNPWGSKHMWLQRACLEHIRLICKFAINDTNHETIVLNTDIDELVHTPDGGNTIFEAVRKSNIDVAHFMRLPVFLKKGTFDVECIKHSDHNLIKKDLKPQAPKNIFNATKLDLNSRMHQHIINSGEVRSVQFLNVFASHCIGINNGWKYQSNEMKSGWSPSANFLDYDLNHAHSIIADLVSFDGDEHSDWRMKNKMVSCIYFPI
tara:strand:- start:1865 stop:3076 length:1212 start_codon:yes stop_codon:yes gene_type:complete